MNKLFLFLLFFFYIFSFANDLEDAYDEQNKYLFYGSLSSAAIFLVPQYSTTGNINWDNEIDDYFGRYKREDKVGTHETWYSKMSFPFSVAPFFAAYAFNDKNKDIYIDTMLYLQMLSFHIGIKGISTQFMRRERPDGSDSKSFPSGHSAHMFMSVHFMSSRYEWSLFSSSLAYAAATAFSFTRIVDGKHYFTDTVAGAALGVGISALILNLYDKDNKVKVVPQVTNNHLILNVVTLF